jgi:tetratricopeptide (TPR) repeat protein
MVAMNEQTMKFSVLTILGLLLLAGLAGAVRADALDDDPLLAAMAAEFALQEGDTDEAAQWYGRAVDDIDDVAWLERATLVALHARAFEDAHRIATRWLEVSGEDLRARQALAWVALAEGRVQRAVEQLKALIDAPGLEGDRLAVQVMLTREANEQLGPVLAVLGETEHLLSADPDQFSFVPVLLAVDQKEEALRVAEADMARHPHSAATWRWRAQVHLSNDDEEAAAKDFEIAVEREPDNADWRYAYAGLLDRQQDYPRLLRLLADAPVQDDTLIAARIGYAAKAEDDKALQQLWRELNKRKPEEMPRRAVYLGQVAELRERWNDALKWYGQIEPDSDDYADARIRMAVVHSKRDEDLQPARALLAGLRQQSRDPDLRVDAWLLETELLLQKQQRVEAEAVFEQALGEFPLDQRLLYARALARVAADDLVGAEADLRRILNADPDNSQALNALGYTLADRTDRHAEALGYIERALALSPGEGAILDSMGWVLFRLGRTEEALEYLIKAHEAASDAEIAAHYGEVLWTLGRQEEAKVVWKKALEASPEDPVLQETLRRLAPQW